MIRPDDSRKRPDLLPPGLGYGAANLGNLFQEMSDDEAWAILEAAWDGGVRYFDTAPHYGLGLSERRLGAFLATKPRSEFVISTKAGRLLRPNPAGAGTLDLANHFVVPANQRRVWDFTADGIRRSLDESLHRLSLDRVDVIYLHDPDGGNLETALNEGLPAAAAMRDEGTVSAIGVGSMDSATLRAATRSGLVDLLMAGGRHTLLDQSLRAEVLPECRARGIAVVAAAVFNSGLLAKDEPDSDALFDYSPAQPDLVARTRRIAKVCREYGVSLPAAALQYPLREPAVRSVVAGGGTADQVRENIQRMADPIPLALWDDLAAKELVTS